MPPEPFAQAVTFLYAEDPAPCRAFYAEVLGLPMVLDQGRCAIFAVAANRAFLGICEARGPRQLQEARSEGGSVHTFVTADVDGWHAHLRAAGATDLTAPTLSKEFNVYGFFFRDPAGYLFEVQSFRAPEWPGA
ncbi:VOC family protein [Plastoroseomonas arctica]|uniref:VOC family protein n=1 Tax=Plastoroseomonas arctica TaxID=1509237 RepID=A0AAF1KPN0_9PROT|nr:VOC family protein [Plastoroseomonas arctica]MBR0656233.1 VOC family protein [Plastoroseomonas arctica]